MTPFLQACTKAAVKIKKILIGGWRDEYGSRFEIGAGGDRTAGIDRVAEEIYIEVLGSFGEIDSEESGLIGSGSHRVILDPIDGSDNALSGLPYFGSSIALEKGGRVEEAVVINLANGDIFYKGDGPLRVGRIAEERFVPVVPRRESRLGILERAYAYPDIVQKLYSKGVKFRSPGAVALSLAYAHYVDFVIFAGPRRSYDFAAALWMCEELEIYEEDRLLIVSKSREMLESLKRLVVEDEG